jgi:hypothetical protein
MSARCCCEGLPCCWTMLFLVSPSVISPDARFCERLKPVHTVHYKAACPQHVAANSRMIINKFYRLIHKIVPFASRHERYFAIECNLRAFFLSLTGYIPRQFYSSYSTILIILRVFFLLYHFVIFCLLQFCFYWNYYWSHCYNVIRRELLSF